MTLPSDILSRSADEAVRRIAIHLLDEAREAASRILDDDARPEAYVVVARGALRALAVHIHLLGERLGVRADGADALWPTPELARDPASYARATLALAERAAPMLRRFSIELDAESHPPSYGVVLAGVLRWTAAELVAALEDLEARPTAEGLEGVAELALAASDLLAPAAATAACEPARAACTDLARRAAGAPEAHGVLAGEASREHVRALLERAASALESRTESEIEHKFLLRAFPPRAADVNPKRLDQGYVPGERLHERLRSVQHDGEVKYIRTVKIGSGLARMEIEEETTEDVFRAMWPLTEGCRIRKERYAVRDGALTWTIDRFVDRDLVLAEVEVPSREIAPSPPAWLADYIVRDVTGDPAYVNLNLAR